MRVVQMARTFASLTQTYLYTELAHLRRYEGLMLTRNAQNLEHFSGVEVVAFSQQPRGPEKALSDLLYGRLRIMAPHERQFFCRALAQARPDLLHVHHAVDACYFASVIRQFSLPVIVECHGYDTSSFPHQYGGLGRRYLRAAWTVGDAFLAMSDDMRSDMIALGCPAEKIRVYYRGINLGRFPYIERPVETELTRILFVGRLDDERKGVEYLLQAFDRLARDRGNVELRLVGEGRFRKRYEQLAASLGIGDRTSLAGYVPHVELVGEYGAAHIFCHPSVVSADGAKEGIPGTVVEAMATGLPVVTTLHAGIPEMVTDGRHGFLLAEKDVAGIAESLRRLVDTPELRQRLGRAAARRVRERGDAVRQAAVLEGIYDEVVEAHSAHRRQTGAA